MASETYIHGFSESEQQRLTRMQDILNQAELRELDLAGVRSIVDVGCGLGQFSRAMARHLMGTAQVIGVERDARQRAEAARQAEAAGEVDLVEFRAGSAETLPLSDEERGNFDVAHARFLLEHVTEPLAVVREMVAAVRPGGRVVLVDDDHELLRLSPDCPELLHAWTVYWESYRDHGFDPLIGRRLPSLLAEAGAEPDRVANVFYGATKGDSMFDLVVDNLVGVLAGAAPGLEDSGRMKSAEMDRALEALTGWRSGTGATVWYSLPLAEGVRP